jgi:hypothetical protein
MAFNPFHAFRKHQRPLLAVLAIFCMFMFVLSSGMGKGDIVYQVLGFFGAGRVKGNLVTTLHGRKVYEGDLARLRRDRDMASDFLLRVARLGGMQKIFTMSKDIRERQTNKDQLSLSPEVMGVVGNWSFILSQLGGAIPRENKKLHEFALKDLDTVRAQIRIQNFMTPSAEALHSLEQLEQAVALIAWESGKDRNSKEYYFGGTPDTASLLDFILWEQQADRLGVELTEADLIAAANREACDQGLLSPPTLGINPIVEDYLRSSNTVARGATPDDLKKALEREFRYVLAREAVLGKESGARSLREGAVLRVPAAGTPREFLDWFREQRTTLKVAALPVRVRDYVGRIKESPPESTLRALYEQYKGDEPAPDQPLPGFKEPRRVRVETVSARGDSSFYRDAARAQALAPVVGGLFGGPFGGPVSAGWPAAYDPLWREYEMYAGDTRSWVERGIGVSVDLADRRPMYAAVAGLTLGATPGGQFVAGATAGAENVYYDVALAKVAGSLVPAGAGCQPLAALGLLFPYEATVLPPEKLEGSLFTKVVDGLVPRLVTKNLDDVTTEVAKFKNRPSEAREYINKAVKQFGLDHHLTEQPKTRYQLADDPALRPLKEAVEAESAAAPDSAVTDLANVVLSGAGVYDPQRFPPERWSVVKEPFLWWRVEDLPARERPYDVVRGQVEAAWRFEQARVLARAEAIRVEEAVKTNVAANHSAAEAVKVLRSYGHEFELNDVARLLPVNTARAELGQPYQPYAPPHDLVSYPRLDFVDRLMALKQPGDVTVLRDKPAATMFVAVLEDRSDPTLTDSKPDLRAFREEYRNADKPGSMWQQQFMPDLRRAYVRQVEKQMRFDATEGKVDEQGIIILPENISRGTESEGGE